MECLEEGGLDGSLVMGCVWSLTMLVVIRMGRKRKMGSGERQTLDLRD